MLEKNSVVSALKDFIILVADGPRKKCFAGIIDVPNDGFFEYQETLYSGLQASPRGEAPLFKQ